MKRLLITFSLLACMAGPAMATADIDEDPLTIRCFAMYGTRADCQRKVTAYRDNMKAREMASTQPAAPAYTGLSMRNVSDGLSSDDTEAQRDAYWARVKGSDVSWDIHVSEVRTGVLYGFTIDGRGDHGLKVSCDLGRTPEESSRATSIKKGDRITCAGKLRRYSMFLGKSVTIDSEKR
jgi:hypothetical protein